MPYIIINKYGTDRDKNCETFNILFIICMHMILYMFASMQLNPLKTVWYE